jgi:hypothetical protein
MFIAVVEVPCGDKTHRVGITKKREFIPLNHDAATVAAFKAFGAEPPPCVKYFEEELARTRYKDPRAAFGWWLLNAWRSFTNKELYELTLLADPIRRVEIVRHRHASLTPDQIMNIMRMRGITDRHKGEIALSVPLPRKYALELADAAPEEMKCTIAREAGSWLPSKKRAEYAWYCTEAIAIREVLHRLTLADAFKLAKRFSPNHVSHWGGVHPGYNYGDYDNRIKVAMTDDLNFTPAQRVALVMSIPKGMRSRQVGAQRLHRRRKHFELTPTQIKRLEKAMR